MADLIFGCTGVTAERYAATPTLTFSLTITERSGVRVHAIALRCQIRVEPHRRRYSAAEAQRLHDLFGDPSRWAETVKPIQLATVTTMVPTFTAVTEADVQVPVTYDLEVTSARYLYGLDDGTVPLLLLFSGTVFVANGDGFSVELVPWSAEASYRMPVSIWRELADAHFPNSAWLRCSRETLDELSAFKAKHALPTWDATLRALLALRALRWKDIAAPDDSQGQKFGLDKPEVEVTVLKSDGTEMAKLAIGRSEGTAAYVQSKSAPGVYVVDPTTLDEIRKAPTDIPG